MSDINKEIDQVADQLEKSHKSPKEVLFDTIRALGPAGVRAKLSTLEKSEQELLLSALQEMKKAVSMDDAYAAKYVQGNIEETKIQEDKADDNQDEKLVKPAAADIAHQGSPTEGWEGQVIKAQEIPAECDEKMEKDLVNSGLHKDWDSMVSHLQSKNGGGHSKESAEKIAGYINNKYVHHYAHGVKKAKDMSKEQAKDKIMAMEEKEHKTKDPKKLVEAEKKEHEKKDMKKGQDMKDEKKVKMMDKDAVKKIKSGKKDAMVEGLKDMKKSIEEQLRSFGQEPTVELVKAEMKRLLAEESQDGDAPEMNEKTRANKESVEALNLAADNKKAQDKVNDEKQGQGGSMKKSAAWAGENDMLKAMTGGRNHHFSLEEYLAEVLKTAEKGGETVQKSEGSKKDDLNDIIAKGGDTTWDHLNTERMVKANQDKVNGKLVKSFSDNEIAQALGLSEEEAKKILGE